MYVFNVSLFLKTNHYIFYTHLETITQFTCIFNERSYFIKLITKPESIFHTQFFYNMIRIVLKRVNDKTGPDP